MTTPQILTTENSSFIFGDKKPPLVPDFQILDDVPQGDSETFLIYGGSGTGKTRLLGTCGDRALILNNGNGLSTLQSPLFRELINSHPIVATLTEKMGKRGIFADADVHDALCDTIDYALEKFPERFDFVCIDDGTQLRKGAMNKALELNNESGKSETLKKIRLSDSMEAAVQDFGREMSIIETFVANYTTICQQAKKHFILCAHERFTFKKGKAIGDTPELIRTAPSFTGVDKNPSQITGYFDNVWYSEVVGSGSNRLWRLTTKGHEQLNAKTRMDGVFETVETIRPNDMFMLNAINRIREGVKVQKAKR